MPTKQDLEGLIENYAWHIIDGLDHKSADQMLFDLLTREYEKMSWDEVTEEIVDLYDEDTLIDLIPDAKWRLMASATFPHFPVYRYESGTVWKPSIMFCIRLIRACIIKGTKQRTWCSQSNPPPSATLTSMGQTTAPPSTERIGSLSRWPNPPRSGVSPADHLSSGWTWRLTKCPLSDPFPTADPVQ